MSNSCAGSGEKSSTSIRAARPAGSRPGIRGADATEGRVGEARRRVTATRRSRKGAREVGRTRRACPPRSVSAVATRARTINRSRTSCRPSPSTPARPSGEIATAPMRYESRRFRPDLSSDRAFRLSRRRIAAATPLAPAGHGGPPRLGGQPGGRAGGEAEAARRSKLRSARMTRTRVAYCRFPLGFRVRSVPGTPCCHGPRDEEGEQP
jgi:hypothetical protein